MWKKSTPEIFIEIDIVGFKHCCLLDAGCDYYLIPCRLVPTATLMPVNMDIFTVNEIQIQILRWMQICFAIQGIPVVADLLVSEDVHEFMLGYDWLVVQGAH